MLGRDLVDKVKSLVHEATCVGSCPDEHGNTFIEFRSRGLRQRRVGPRCCCADEHGPNPASVGCINE